MASREELLESIQPGMRLNKAFFLKVYGYEISFPGFSEIAIKALEDAGCSKARQYYDDTVAEQERKNQSTIKEVAALYLGQSGDSRQLENKKEGEEIRIEKYLSNSLQKNCSAKQKDNLEEKLKRLKALI